MLVLHYHIYNICNSFKLNTTRFNNCCPFVVFTVRIVVKTLQAVFGQETIQETWSVSLSFKQRDVPQLYTLTTKDQQLSDQPSKQKISAPNPHPIHLQNVNSFTTKWRGFFNVFDTFSTWLRFRVNSAMRMERASCRCDTLFTQLSNPVVLRKAPISRYCWVHTFSD